MLASLSAAAAVPGLAQEATPDAQEDISGTEVAGVTVLPPDASYAGAPRGEWDARSWQWIASIPGEINPGFDPTGERCGYGQHGPVFFLPGFYGPDISERTCIVPEGAAIFVSAVAAECSTVEAPPAFGRDEAELRECAAKAMAAVTDVAITINGEEVPSVQQYRTTSPLFTLLLPEHNFFVAAPGAAQAVSDGYSVIIAPPAPGEYDVTVALTYEGYPEPFEATIHVVVVAPQVIGPSASPEAGAPAATPAA